MFGKLKNFFVSRTIRASVAGIVVSIAGMAGLTLTEADVNAWVSLAPLIVTTITSLISIAGRVQAQGPINVSTIPAIIVPVLNAVNALIKQRESEIDSNP